MRVALTRPVLAAVLAALLLVPAASRAPAAQDAASCTRFLVPTREVDGQTVGSEECRIVDEHSVDLGDGRLVRRLELRLSGTVAGIATRDGPRADYFTDVPEFVFPQSGNVSPRYRGIARYSAEAGTGMTVLYPEDGRGWNGKLFVTVHGGGNYTPVGELLPREPGGRHTPLQGANHWIGLMLDKGYAVVHTIRATGRGGSDVTVALEDGSTLGGRQLSDHTGLILEMTQTAQALLAERLGQRPMRTYLTGHSGGGRMGHSINYYPGVNRDASGARLIDGILAEDAGSGQWRPFIVADGRDTLFTTGEDRARFVPQLDVSHQAYAFSEVVAVGEAGRGPAIPVVEDYLANKRFNALMLLEKGLGDRHRMYEVRGVSHFDAGRNLPRAPDLVSQNLDLSGLYDALLDALDAWVERDVAPPATRSDLPELRHLSGGGEAIALPELACPLGVYYIFPEGWGSRNGYQQTGFARFDGSSLEPLDARGVLVDLNGNGVRDRRETPAEAWQRLGLLAPGEALTAARYQSCVQRAAERLVGDRLLTPRAAAYYVEQASAQQPAGGQ